MRFIITFGFLIAVLAISASGFAADTDRDGLTDDVEAQLGSNPLRKDIFVEVDWMVVNGRNLKPKKGFTQIVESIFETAPVTNPDGSTGITIHIDLDDSIPLDVEAIGYFESNGSYNWDDFDILKDNFFTPSRRNTHHYVVFVKDIGDEHGFPSTISGMSRNGAKFKAGASDFIVALGNNAWYNSPTKKLFKWTQAGTFVHELGHNLGLKHGGNNHFPYKPNFLSLMNYSFQTDGIPYTAFDGTRYLVFDLSRQKLPTLRESNLNEGSGLGASASDDSGVYGTRWYSWNGFGYDYYETFNATRNVDWNGSGSINSGVAEDLNQDGRYGSLKGKADWNRVVFTGGSVGGLVSTADLPRQTELRCQNWNEYSKRRPKEDSAIERVTLQELKEKLRTK